VQEGGFVTAATDMGHQGNDPAWTTDPQKQADFAYRGQHITTLAAKKLIKAYYGQEQKYSYFVGCSDGGREALMAAQRYPNDYNGIVAGAPAAHFQVQNSVFHGWSVIANSTTGTSAGNSILYADKIALLHKAVVAACADTPDGLISDPRACNFDPASIQCAVGATDTSNCLTAPRPAPPARSTAVRSMPGIAHHGMGPPAGRSAAGTRWSSRFVAGDRAQGLHVAQLHRAGLLRQHLRRLLQLFRGLQLAFGMDHLGPPLALGLGLAGDRAHHRLVEVDVLDLDVGDLDAPGVGLGVEHLLDVEVQAFALGQHLVELVLAQHGAQVVCASWLVASRKFATWMMAFPGRPRGNTARRSPSPTRCRARSRPGSARRARWCAGRPAPSAAAPGSG
jgi:hypothetical protein